MRGRSAVALGGHDFQDSQDFQDRIFGTAKPASFPPRQRPRVAQEPATHQPRPWHWGQKARLLLAGRYEHWPAPAWADWSWAPQNEQSSAFSRSAAHRIASTISVHIYMVHWRW
ncbi:hypothetical protein NW754_016581 [Fusarium falciforme]|uniref:Uncharacterized protein n=1 Tax=Fusarium falciforme TaxID=195108 RepID=A0A9W8R3V1_9HYPO|nr:hypothetical protein NW754_016581 [Fusarium falciforme]KAJ4184198.1 hypothetical protein NW755_009204 [Fusarium falciforme]KAJ4187821.1 hypothetical protein NW767_012096 [Fusarium falciforme]KAJ4259455.1 hypothetical protein NW757_002778 [Fusarium falciforme]